MADPDVRAPCWLELGGSPTTEVLDFYATQLGWTYDLNPADSGYRRSYSDGLKVAGFGGPVTPRPDRGWRIYIGVEDLETTCALAINAGASALSCVTVVPDGRFMWIRDPRGRACWVVRVRGRPRHHDRPRGRTNQRLDPADDGPREEQAIL
ncbi:hypothetical protein [Nocardioides sp. B-3]|uniref:hypothetical protein n=1 Tax=Nocardioides sp. B-3 TaxID=2895565 RepID=UPI002152FF2D|nr:hypothetical protein [Nocardioides sp. B-3]UUZ60284.1 hypothetical protein LP418_04965 [Nocardioides sp. B-3]